MMLVKFYSMEILSEVARFAFAVLKHWQAYMTGGILMAVLTVHQWMTRKAISRRIAVFAIGAFFLVAFFMAWRDQYHAALRAEDHFKSLTTPRFQGAIDMVSASPTTMKGDALVVVTAHVENLGAPSVAEFSDCKISTSFGKTADGEFGPIPSQLAVTFNEPKLENAKPALIYSREDNLLIRATAAPIPTGGAVSGWLYVMVHGISEEDVLRPGTVISITVKDVRGQALSLKYSMTAANVHKGLSQDLP